MPQSQGSSRLPKLIRLFWGADRLEVDDPIWIAKIVQEMAQNAHPDDDIGPWLFEPRSLRNERIEANMRTIFGVASRSVDPEAIPGRGGYQPPDQQGPVAVEALKEFMGLELPAALNFTDHQGRSESRISAVHTAFMRCWTYSIPDELNLCWMFKGYQLYATHHIGTAHRRPRDTQDGGHIERRLLNGQWVRWGFDGASPRPVGRQWFSSRRKFILAPSGIQRIDQFDSDLKSENDDRNDAGAEGTPQSQEAI